MAHPLTSLIEKNRPRSEERPDLVRDQRAMDMRIALSRAEERQRLIDQLPYVGLMALVAVAIVALSVYHNVYEVHHIDVISRIFN